MTILFIAIFILVIFTILGFILYMVFSNSGNNTTSDSSYNSSSSSSSYDYDYDDNDSGDSGGSDD